MAENADQKTLNEDTFFNSALRFCILCAKFKDVRLQKW